MTLLDCETVDSALATSAGVLDLHQDEISRRLVSFDWGALSESEKRSQDYRYWLLRHAFGNKCDLPTPDEIFWFHATRVPPFTTFAKGILPTPDAWPAIHDFMVSLGCPPRQFKRHLGKPPGEEDGPMGFLVRPTIFQPDDLWYHDYLRIPEVVEDHYTDDEQRRYIEATSPCIVKYRSGARRPDALGAAMMFLHSVLHDIPMSMACNTFHSNMGQRVEPTAIVGIEWPDKM